MPESKHSSGDGSRSEGAVSDANRSPLREATARWGRDVAGFFSRPKRLISGYRRVDVLPDLRASVTVAAVLVPQAIAYAAIADLPPAVGLYAAVVASIVGAIWGSSSHLQTGPTNTASLLVLATLAPVVAAGTSGYVAAAGLLAVMAGLIRLALGVARMGILVRFVSSSVIVGFTAGAGILIGLGQLRHLFRLGFQTQPSIARTLSLTAEHLSEIHVPSLAVGLGTLAVVVLVKKLRPRWPAALMGLAVAEVVVATLRLDQQGVQVLGGLPGGLPPFSPVPLFDGHLWSEMFSGALAVAAIGLVEAVAISRSIAAKSGERLEIDQEFVGQGLANIAAGLFSGYPSSGSFTRSALNYSAGARTGLSGVFAGLIVLLAMLALAPVGTYLPRAALAGVLLVVAFEMVDFREMRRILRASVGDSAIMLSTLLATLLVPLDFAVLAGIAVSFARYIIRSSRPDVSTVTPDESFRHLIRDELAPSCPQLGIISIRGSLYFGATQHVEEVIRKNAEAHPEQRYLLLRMHVVDHCDVAGVRMLESVVRLYRERGGDVFLVRVRAEVDETMRLLQFDALLGEDHFLDQDEAIGHLFHEVLDPAICVYDCPYRVFAECKAVPKYDKAADLPPEAVAPPEPLAAWTAAELLDRLERREDPEEFELVDVREPDEYREGHIPGARLMPLSSFLDRLEDFEVPVERPIVLVCRTGRRSARAAYILKSFDYDSVYKLEGGMLAWTAVGQPLVVGVPAEEAEPEREIRLGRGRLIPPRGKR